MTYEFQYDIRQLVEVLDYNEPRQRHRGIILKRWLEEKENTKNELEEHYEVLLEHPLQKGEFLGSDIQPAC